jgi:hypothetical protein
LLLAATLAAPGLASATPARADGPCDLALREGERIPHRMARIIRCATDRWPVRGGAERAICIAERESGLDPKATSAHRAYVGIYQHRALDWPDRFSTWTRRVWALDDSALIGRSNIIVAIRMVNANGWGPWRGVDGC